MNKYEKHAQRWVNEKKRSESIFNRNWFIISSVILMCVFCVVN